MQFFTKEEAEAKVGKEVKMIGNLPGIPFGITGLVIGVIPAYRIFSYTVEIQWNNQGKISAPFSKDGYEVFWQELS